MNSNKPCDELRDSYEEWERLDNLLGKIELVLASFAAGLTVGLCLFLLIP